jgi:hypothetical protein
VNGEARDSVAATGALLAFGALLLAPAASRASSYARYCGESRHSAQAGRAFGLAIGLAIAGYTRVDSEGLDHADPLAYLFLVAAVSAVAYCSSLVATGQGGELRKSLNRSSLLMAAAVFGAYAMVLAALELAPAAAAGVATIALA